MARSLKTVAPDRALGAGADDSAGVSLVDRNDHGFYVLIIAHCQARVYLDK